MGTPHQFLIKRVKFWTCGGYAHGDEKLHLHGWRPLSPFAGFPVGDCRTLQKPCWMLIRCLTQAWES